MKNKSNKEHWQWLSLGDFLSHLIKQFMTMSLWNYCLLFYPPFPPPFFSWTPPEHLNRSELRIYWEEAAGLRHTEIATIDWRRTEAETRSIARLKTSKWKLLRRPDGLERRDRRGGRAQEQQGAWEKRLFEIASSFRGCEQVTVREVHLSTQRGYIVTWFTVKVHSERVHCYMVHCEGPLREGTLLHGSLWRSTQRGYIVTWFTVKVHSESVHCYMVHCEVINSFAVWQCRNRLIGWYQALVPRLPNIQTESPKWTKLLHVWVRVIYFF